LRLRLSGEELLPSGLGKDQRTHFSPREGIERLRETTGKIDGFRVTYDAAVGDFGFYKMAMVADLKSEPAWLYESDLVVALSRSPARQMISSERAKVDPCELGGAPPENEFLVLDADSSQQATIAAALSLQSGVIVDHRPKKGTFNVNQNADLVLGQSNFTSGNCAVSQTTFENPRGLGFAHKSSESRGTNCAT
jgi:hypothetical protein